MAEPVQDTIQFALLADETVINTTVRLTATIECMVRTDVDQTTVTNAIRKMMQEFLNDDSVTWQFSNMERAGHRTGMEQIILRATARVPESQNHSLDKRARAVSTEGLTITGIKPDTTPPAYMIEAAESNLRIKLLEKALNELKLINQSLSGDPANPYRLGDLIFRDIDDSAGNMSNSLTRMSGKTAIGGSYGSGFGDDDGALGNALKLTLHARVVLRKST